MSIDYEQLQARLAKAEDTSAHRLDRVAANVVLEANAKDMARELLRLRDGVKQVADDLGEKAEYAPNIARQAAYVEAEQRLNHLLNGSSYVIGEAEDTTDDDWDF